MARTKTKTPKKKGGKRKKTRKTPRKKATASAKNHADLVAYRVADRPTTSRQSPLLIL